MSLTVISLNVVQLLLYWGRYPFYSSYWLFKKKETCEFWRPVAHMFSPNDESPGPLPRGNHRPGRDSHRLLQIVECGSHPDIWGPVVPFVSRVSLFSKLILSFFSFSEYFFQCAGGICSLWRYPVAWWGWRVLRPLLHRERPGGPPGAGGRAVQHGECTQWSRSLASHWAEFLVLWMWP